VIGAIVQARTGSRRLPGKTLLPLGGMPMLAYILRRLRAAFPGLPVVVATTTLAGDDPLVSLCEHEGFASFRGSEEDVLDRYLQCSLRYGITQIIRLTADNPFTDLDELARLQEAHLLADFGYTHSFAHLPVGTGAEIFSAACLARAHREGHAPHHREHVNEYVLEHPEIFKTQVLDVAPKKRHPELRLTVDTQEDYERACRIVAAVKRPWVTSAEAVAWLLRSA